MHIAEIGTVAKSLPLLRQRLINSSFKAILQIVAYFSQKRSLPPSRNVVKQEKQRITASNRLVTLPTLAHINHFLEKGHLVQHMAVANNYSLFACACEGNIEPSVYRIISVIKSVGLIVDRRRKKFQLREVPHR